MNALLFEVNEFAAGGLAALLNTLWYAAGVVALTWAGLCGVRRVNAATRYWIWIAVLGFLLVLPFFPRLAAWAEHVATPPARVAIEPLVRVPAPPAEMRPPAPVTVPLNSAPGSNPWPLWLLAAWIVAASWQLTRLAIGVASVRRLKARSKAVAIRYLPVSSRRRVRVLVSGDVPSPVAMGYIHPAVIVPPGLLPRLEDGERQDVLLHELAHLARYDDWMVLVTRGLGALLALHPMSAIVLRRIEREGEMACDDFVVAHTGSARGYARSLARLHDLRWSAGSRLLAPALLGGNSQLGERIESLLRRGRAFSPRPSLASLGVSVLLLAVLLAAGGLVPGWIAIAQTKTTLPTSFEVASIKPANPDSQNHAFMCSTHGRLNAINIPMDDLIEHAYGIDSNQLIGLPSWAKSRLYTIEAKPPCDMASFQKDERWEALRQMMQSLLADRFKLKVHRATKQLPVYELVVAKGGPKLEPVSEAEFAAVGGVAREGHPLPGVQIGSGSISAWGQPVSSLANALQSVVGRLVVDKTGVTGRYYIRLKWDPSSGDAGLDSGPTPDNSEPGGTAADANPSAPSIFAALREQLGLKLRSAKGPVEVLVVDHVEPPTPN